MIKHILWKLISKSSCTMHIHQKISRFSMNPAMNSFESRHKIFCTLKQSSHNESWRPSRCLFSPIFREFTTQSSFEFLSAAHGAAATLPLERLANQNASFLTVWSGADLWAPLIGPALDSTRIMDAITQEQGPVTDSHSWQSFRDQ